MAKGKNVLTTGDVARICHVAPRTVSKWFDSGQLRGYRIPASRDRRIPVNELKKFMKENNIPTDSLPVGNTRILVADSSHASASALCAAIKNKMDCDIEVAASSFDVGVMLGEFSPNVLLINLLADKIDAAEICANIRKKGGLNSVRIIAIANSLKDSEKKALHCNGFDGCIDDICDIDKVIGKLEQ